jgi:ferredoxin
MAKITFDISDIEAVWDGEIENLLEFAEEQGISPDYSCRAGSCSSCRTRILSGEVEYVTEPVERPEAGFVLLCCSQPKGDVTLEL